MLLSNEMLSDRQPRYAQQPVLRQNGMVIWLLGLSGAGKSTIAGLLKATLTEHQYFAVILDGDQLRQNLNKDLSFSVTDRMENIRRTAEMASLLVQNQVITICALITPLQEYRDLVKSTVRGKYFEVFVDCPMAVCENRDVKGLYKQARENKISDFTGIGSVFAPALQPDLVLRSAEQSAEDCAAQLFQQVIPYIAG